MNFDAISNSSWASELRENVRLQWMLLAIVCILLLSGIKTGIDSKNEKLSELQQQQMMVDKLIRAANRPIESTALDSAQQAAEALTSRTPGAPTASVAEAQALTEIDTLSNKLLSKARAKLIGTTELDMQGQVFWQVRVEVNGQLDSMNLIAFLEHFDGSQPFMRLPTFQYRPNAGKSLTIVVDYLYKKDNG